MTCATCFDCDCDRVGQDLRACEHHVRMDDVDPEPESVASRTDTILSDLTKRVDLIAGQMQTMQMQWDDFWAAVLKVRAGEGL